MPDSKALQAAHDLALDSMHESSTMNTAMHALPCLGRYLSRQSRRQ